MMDSTVLVTGSTGFLAQHVIDKLLQRKYEVIGTTRSEEKSAFLLNNFKGKYPSAKLSFEVVADIAAKDAFDELLKKHPEIKYVIHTASPVTPDSAKSFEAGYLAPALNGTLSILNAIKLYAPQVTNVVITSSYAALTEQGNEPKGVVITNKSWNPMNWEDVKTWLDAYSVSKKYAEQAAWKFCEDEKPSFKLATVNPPFVLGPQVFDNSLNKQLNVSNNMLSEITHIDPAATGPQTMSPVLAISAPDIAEFHILPLENKELENERLFVVGAPLIAQKVLNILNDNFPELRGKIAKGDYDSADDLIAELCPKYDISATVKKASDYKFASVENAIVDVFKQYLSKYSI
ncbi:hypothetical protein PICMEDRAFT_14522 [Pichia membranifaciens NRRL Y-2026]|uniref:NAD-dependent epimerase/dehydratase domain-containing protein n=1 Tax=Pichia membranifaciens NRRL Y-2026 TaxID=763406 RepID=A0A1E3NSE5_9ASCO|nr:hypothetical protein PICMEDRAFT_14522 [Pichia membranifaciens NRRL Y-2026]ODQ49021.1 hypothetical protein PICMEDRAFT_14522 [Pichia membranifaciens NRRL Y-2026]